MPNGVICAGAVDGSNQLGAMVTCHAMATSPGPGCATASRHDRKAMAATSSRTVRWREHVPTAEYTPMCASRPGTGNGQTGGEKVASERGPVKPTPRPGRHVATGHSRERPVFRVRAPAPRAQPEAWGRLGGGREAPSDDRAPAPRAQPEAWGEARRGP